MPILKSKHGEFLGLAKLSNDIKKNVVPLIEITPLEWSSEGKVPKSIEDHLELFCKRYLQNWNSNNCFIDSKLMKSDGVDNTPKIEYVFQRLREKNIIPLPVVHVGSSVEYIEAIKRIRVNQGITEIGIRISPDEVTSLEFDDDIKKLLNKLLQTPKSCHLIFDLVDSNFSEVDNLAAGIIGVLTQFPFLEEWKSFTITGSAFPASKSIKEGISEFERNDWKFYQKLLHDVKNKSFKRTINFGDYSIINPGYFEFDPRFMKPSANIKYTLDEKWVVVKGKKLGSAKDYVQYKSLAKKIADADFFLGEEFSTGDQYVVNCANGKAPTGQPRTWVWVGHSHHITKTVLDLFSNQDESLDS